MTTMVGSTWEDVRKQARLLETDIDMKLVAFSKLGVSSGTSGLSSENVPLINSDDMFETMSMELQQLLSKSIGTRYQPAELHYIPELTETSSSHSDGTGAESSVPRSLSSINDKMSDLAPSGSATMHTIKRHREILMDYQQEFSRTSARVCARREREELLGAATHGLSRREQYAKETAHLHSSHILVDEQINIAMEARDHLTSQRQVFKRMQTRFNDITNRFPMLNSLLYRIQARRRRDALAVGGVVALCTFLLLLYAFH